MLIYCFMFLLSILAATKQLYKWFSQSVCPSICPPICHTFFTMFPSLYHHDIFRTYCHWQKQCPCKGLRSEVKGQGHRGQKPTWQFPDCNSVWICRWLRNDAQLKVAKGRCPIVFKVIRQISWSHGTKNPPFWPKLGVSRL